MFVVANLESFLLDVLPVHNIITISGASGIGKSEIVYQVCNQLSFKVLEVRLYEEGETAAGLPFLDNSVTMFSMPYWFKELLDDGYNVLFLDDFHLVVPAIQKYLYKLLTHKMLHHYKIKKDLKIIIAGNFRIESADASEIQSPIMSRIEFFVQYEPDVNQFIKWGARSNRIDPRILAYLRINPEDLYTDEPPTTEKYPCPRTWEMLSKHIQAFNNAQYAPAIIGDDCGAKFIDFWNFLETDLNQLLNTIVNNVNDEIRIAIALASYYTQGKKQSEILSYIQGLCAEAQFLFAKAVYDRIKDKTMFLTDLKTKARPVYDSLLEIAKEIL